MNTMHIIRKSAYLFLLLIIACGQTAKHESSDIPVEEHNTEQYSGNALELLKTGLQKTEICSEDQDHSYEIYIPKSGKTCERLPLFIILSPQGDGTYALNHFIKGANEYPCILVASNLIRNNYPRYIEGLNTLIRDVKSKYPVNKQLILAGFSGGARMCLDYARRYSPDGIIAMGGLASPEQLNSVNCDIISLTGLADFNFLESAQFIFKKPESLRLSVELTTKSHEWASEESIERAMAHLLLSEADKEYCFSIKELKAYCRHEEAYINQLRKGEKYLQAELVRRKMIQHDQYSQEADFSYLQQYEGLYLEELNKLAQSLKLELALREEYMKDLQLMDVSWWENEIKSLDARIHMDQDIYQRFAYLRLKAFLGIISYSLTNRSIQQNMFSESERLLAIYKMLEPQNPDMLYFSALHALRTGQQEKAKVLIIEAMDAGFNDKQKLRKEFPEDFLKQIVVK